MIKRFNDFILESVGSIREFTIVEPDDDYPFKMVSNTLENGKKVVIGVMPVIFSYRIVAGYEDVQDYRINYCSGNDPAMVKYLFNIILNILRYKKGDPFQGWPYQEIKPYFNDKKNFPKLLKMLPKDLVSIEIPDVKEIRKIYYDRHNINLDFMFKPSKVS